MWWLNLIGLVAAIGFSIVKWNDLSNRGRLAAGVTAAALLLLLIGSKALFWWLALMGLIGVAVNGAIKWRGSSTAFKRNSIVSAVALLLLMLFMGREKKAPLNFMGSEAAAAAPVVGDQAQHTVARGDWLRTIAPRYRNVGWESILLRNEPLLQAKYVEVCWQLSERYTNNPRRRGTFCNDRFNRAYGNTLVPGWVLAIPSGQAPQQITDAVLTSTGQKVAIVIDDTGSMNDDRTRVALFYDAALRKHGKDLIGVYLYADGQVRHYEQGNVVLQTTGDRENTWHALTEAAAEDPDTIILVTDEIGDDWPSDLKKAVTGWFSKMPPVVATCLPPYDCERTLTHLVDIFGGKYVRYTGQ